MVTVPLRSRKRKRALALQRFQHVIPSIPLLSAGLQALRGEPHGFTLVLALFEIGTSVLLLGTVVRELRSLRRGHDSHPHAADGVDWFHVFAAGVLLAEAAEHWHLTRHWARPTLLMATVTLVLGLAHGRVERLSVERRALRIDDVGIHVGGKFFFTAFDAAWPEVDAVEIGARFASIRLKGGRERRIDLADCGEPAPVIAALRQAQARIGGPTG